MYKSTRHTNRMWTYSPGAIGQYAAVSENEAMKLISECRSMLIGLALLDKQDFANMLPDGGPLGNTRFVNGRIRSGYAYLRKIGIPNALVVAVPNYFLIAPKLGKLLARLSDRRVDELPRALLGVHAHVQRYGAPDAPHGRPQFLMGAYRAPTPSIAGASISTTASSRNDKTKSVSKEKHGKSATQKKKAQPNRTGDSNDCGKTKFASNTQIVVPARGSQAVAPREGRQEPKRSSQGKISQSDVRAHPRLSEQNGSGKNPPQDTALALAFRAAFLNR